MAPPERPAWGMESCCRGGDRSDVTQVDVRGDGLTVGIVGLKQLFEQLYAEGLSPDEALGDRILAAVKVYNYVSRSAEGAYKAALLREYAAFRAHKQSSHCR